MPLKISLMLSLILLCTLSRPVKADERIQSLAEWLGPDLEVTQGSPLLCMAFLNRPGLLGGSDIGSSFAIGRIEGPKDSLASINGTWGFLIWKDVITTGRRPNVVTFFVKADPSGMTPLKLTINGHEHNVVLKYKVVPLHALNAQKKDWIEARLAALMTRRVDKPLVIETSIESFSHDNNREKLDLNTTCYGDFGGHSNSYSRIVEGKQYQVESINLKELRPLSKMEALWRQWGYRSARPWGRLGSHLIWLEQKRGRVSYWAVSPENRISRSIELFGGSFCKDTQYIKWAVSDGYERPAEWEEWHFGSQYMRNPGFRKHSVSRWHLGPVPAKAQELLEKASAERRVRGH